MWQPPPPPPPAFIAYVKNPSGVTAYIKGTSDNDRISIVGSRTEGIILLYNGDRIPLDRTVTALDIDCGPGDDIAIAGADVPVVLRGGPGDDTLYTDPEGPEDIIMGGPGDDKFLGDERRDLFLQDSDAPILRDTTI